MNAHINRRVEQQFRSGVTADLANEQRGALALFELATRTGDGGADTPVAMTVVVDADTLLHGLHERSVIDLDGGGTVPVDTLRRLACDAEILPVVMGGPGQVIDVGRAQRVATAKQRAVLRALHPACAIPGCGVRFEHTKIHHLNWWERGGSTDLANLIPVCSRHHHDIHEGGWTVTIDEHRNVTWEAPP